MKKWLKWLLLGLTPLLALAYVSACIWLNLNVARLIFPRNAPFIPPSASLALNQERVEFGEANGTKFVGWIIPCLPQDHSDQWLLYFHGNGSNVSSSADIYDDFRSLGFNVIAPEYPGYSDAPGAPSETLIELESEVAFDYLLEVRRVSPNKVVIFGGSLGAAFAIDLAVRRRPGALVEWGGFTSIIAAAPKYYHLFPLGLLIKNKFDSDKKIGKVNSPVLVMHSTEDTFIPFSHAQTLYTLAPSPKRLVKLRGQHGLNQPCAIVNPDFYQQLVSFLNSEAGFNLRQPTPSIAPVVARVLESQGIDAAIREYDSLARQNPRRYNFREAELDSLGQELLEKHKANDAIEILKLNTEQFPDSFTAFDSLADAYAAAGKNNEAIQNYQRSLALFPAKENYSRTKLERLQHQLKGD
jgi:uncharacterized protein